MKYTTDVYHLTPGPMERNNFAVTPVEAANEAEAAWQAAQIAAEQVYEKGSVGFVNARGHGLFMATIGEYQGGGLTHGHSISIKVTEK
jgi:hypothetical protein